MRRSSRRGRGDGQISILPLCVISSLKMWGKGGGLERGREVNMGEKVYEDGVKGRHFPSLVPGRAWEEVWESIHSQDGVHTLGR